MYIPCKKIKAKYKQILKYNRHNIIHTYHAQATKESSVAVATVLSPVPELSLTVSH